VNRSFVGFAKGRNEGLYADKQPVGALDHGMGRDHSFLPLAPLTMRIARGQNRRHWPEEAERKAQPCIVDCHERSLPLVDGNLAHASSPAGYAAMTGTGPTRYRYDKSLCDAGWVIIFKSCSKLQPI
jgi:hypothetical protein